MSALADQINESLNNIGFFSPFTENADALENMVATDLVEFSKLVSYLSKQLSRLSNTEEHVNSIETINDQPVFFLEIASFLKEIFCPYKSLTEGSVDERFKSNENKLLLIDFLVSELQAARMVVSNKPEISKNINMQQSDETEEAKAMKKMLISLGFSQPPSNVTATEIWTKIETKCQELLSKLPKGYLGKPIFTAMLNNAQWKQLMQINQALTEDFQMRRELLLTRIDVTIQSFKWADRLKANSSEIATIYQQKRKELSFRPSVKLYYILAARDDLLKQEKTCSSRLMTKSKLHKVLIPNVPDRGGRTGELQPPPPEMPSFMKRTNNTNNQPQRQHQGGRGGHHGGGGGRNNQDTWNEPRRPQSNFEKYGHNSGGGGSGHNSGGGGGYNSGGGGGGYNGGGRGGGGRY